MNVKYALFMALLLPITQTIPMGMDRGVEAVVTNVTRGFPWLSGLVIALGYTHFAYTQNQKNDATKVANNNSQNSIKYSSLSDVKQYGYHFITTGMLVGGLVGGLCRGALNVFESPIIGLSVSSLFTAAALAGVFV